MYLAAALFGLLFFSTIFSNDVLFSIFGFYYRFTDGLIFYFCVAVFVFLLINTLDKGRLVFLLKILVLDAVIVSIVACLQAFGITYYAGVNSSGLILGPSLLGNPDFSAMFLAVIFPFCMAFLILAPKFYSKVYYGLSIFAILLASLVFASRGALLAILASLVFGLFGLFIFHFPKKLFFGFLLILLCGGLFGGWALRTTRPQAFTTIAQSPDNNTIDRLVAWGVALKVIYQHPVLGNGPGTFASFYERNRPQSMAAQIGLFDDPHNLFLKMMVTEGLPFVLVLFGILGLAIYYGIKKLNREQDLITLACLAGLIAWCTVVCFNPVPVPMFILLAIILASLLMDDDAKRSAQFASWFRAFAYFFALVLIVCGLSLAASEHVFGFAKRDYLNQDYSSAYRLSALAHKINPTNQLYETYRIAAEIGLGLNQETSVNDITNFTKVHSSLAGTYVTASDLYHILFFKTNNKIYLQAAISEMDKALSIDKNYAERYGQEAVYYYQLGDLASAREEVEKDLSLKDDDFPAWILLAKFYQLSGDKTSTISALNHAFEIDPDIPQLEYILYLAKTQKDIRTVPIEISTQSSSLD
jgi:O-antigen ligase